MRHRVVGKELSRSSSHRKALRRNMAASLFQHGAVRTTEAKAKELRRFVEKLITLAKKGTLHARRMIIAELGNRDMVDQEGGSLDKTVVQKLFDEIAPKYASRPGGYTRIIRLAERRIGDAGKQVLLQLVEEGSSADESSTATTSRRKKRAAKRLEAASSAEEEATAQTEEEVVEEQAEEAGEETAEVTTEEASEESAEEAAEEEKSE